MTYWKNHIGTDEKVLSGKPHIKGTRLSVEFILGRLATGWSEKDILENYPRLTAEGLRAVFSYTHECMKDGLLFLPTQKRA